MIADIKNLVKTHKSDIILLIAIILISLLSFAAGYLTAKIYDKEQLQFQESSYNWGRHCGIVSGMETFANGA